MRPMREFCLARIETVGVAVGRDPDEDVVSQTERKMGSKNPRVIIAIDNENDVTRFATRMRLGERRFRRM